MTSGHFVLYLLYLAVFFYTSVKWPFIRRSFNHPGHAPFFLGLKIAAGLALTLIYTYYYTDQSKADIYRYFNDSRVIYDVAFRDPVAFFQIMTGLGMDAPDVFKYLLPTQHFSHPTTDLATNNMFIIRVNVVFNFFSRQNLLINTLLLNFIGFIGLVCLYRFLKRGLQSDSLLLLVPVFLLPDVLFWSSGMLKGQLIFAVLGLLLYMSNSFRIGHLAVQVLGLWVLWLIKPYVAVAMMAAVPFLYVPSGWLRVRYLVFGLVAILGLAFVAYVLGAAETLCVALLNKRNEFSALALRESAGSYFGQGAEPADCDHLLQILPQALPDALFRPFIWQSTNAFMALFAVSNTVFWFFVALLFFKGFRFPADYKRNVLLFSLVFAALLYLVIGITVPVAGALVQYRTVAAPFIVVSVLCVIKLNKNKYDNILRPGVKK